MTLTLFRMVGMFERFDFFDSFDQAVCVCVCVCVF